MKGGIGISVLLIIAGVFLQSCNGNEQAVFLEPPPTVKLEEQPQLIQERSAIGSKENPRARRAFETRMLIDPATGTVPFDIKRREMAFSSRLPKKISKSGLRKSEDNEDGWRSIGPYNKGGRTRALALDISDENVILAGGVSGGMWRSDDAGESWMKTTLPSSNHSVTCISQDTRPGKTNIWYFGSGEFTSNSASKKSAPYRGDGVYKSIDGGRSWQQLESTAEGVPNFYNSQFQYIWKILPNPFNSNQDEIFLAAVGAILRSVDGGDTWDVVLGRKAESFPMTDLNNSNLSNYSDIILTKEGVYYAVLSQESLRGTSPDRGVYRSADGINWVEITPSFWPVNYQRTVIAESSTEPDEIYFSINDIEERLLKYRYIRGNGNGSGGRWTDLTSNLPSFGGEVGDYDSQNSYNMVLMTHPADGDVVFLGGTNLYRSNDGFSTSLNTAWIGGYDTANDISVFPGHFVDQHALAFYPNDPNKMLSSNDGGVFVTENSMEDIPNWVSKNTGFVTTQFYTVGIDEFGSRGPIMGGLQDNGTLIANKANERTFWISLLSGDGGYSFISRNNLYYYGSFQFGRIIRMTLDKDLQRQTFTRIDPLGSGESEKLLFVNPYVLAPENQNIMYFAGGDVIWRNMNTTQIPLFRNSPAITNWEKLDLTQEDGTVVSAINASYNPSGTVFYGTADGKVFRLDNASSTSYSVSEITNSTFPRGGYVSSIAIDRRNSNNLAVTFSNYNVISVFYSTDNGDSFQNISGNLEENPDGSGNGPSVRWIEIVSRNDQGDQFYVGTTTGVYSTSELDGANTIWVQEGQETVGNVLVDMVRYHAGDGTLVAASHGNGMFETSVEDVWQTTIENTEDEFAFEDAYPNPFVDLVWVPYSIPRDGLVRARIYSTLGQLIKTVQWSEQFEGRNVLSWDGTNEAGAAVLPGTYICSLEFEDQKIGTRLVLLR